MSIDITALESELFGDLDLEKVKAPTLPPRVASNKKTIRRLSSARQRYESSIRQAVEQTSGSSVMIRAHRGWLEKQGGLVTNWKRRYFYFDPSSLTLAYYKDESMTKKKGEFTIVKDNVVVVHDKDNRQNFTVSCIGRQLKIRASSIETAVTWMACLDNSFFLSSLRQEVESRLDILKHGCIFEKHGRKGSPHDKSVWVSEDETRICWGPTTSTSKSSTSKKIAKGEAHLYIENINSIERGRTTAVFQRKASGRFKNCPDTQCFSFITKERTLDLISDSSATAEAWITSLSYLVLFTRCQKNKITECGRWSPTRKNPTKLTASNSGSSHNEAEQCVEKLEKRGEQVNELLTNSEKLSSNGTFQNECN